MIKQDGGHLVGFAWTGCLFFKRHFETQPIYNRTGLDHLKGDVSSILIPTVLKIDSTPSKFPLPIGKFLSIDNVLRTVCTWSVWHLEYPGNICMRGGRKGSKIGVTSFTNAHTSLFFDTFNFA